ncbi:response regulator, partial [Deferrisoma sp.]
MSLAPLRLLLVDDQADHRLLLRANLEEQDPELGFAEAGSVEEALGHLRDRGADVVLCDFWLGGETGLDLLRRARAE